MENKPLISVGKIATYEVMLMINECITQKSTVFQ